MEMGGMGGSYRIGAKSSPRGMSSAGRGEACRRDYWGRLRTTCLLPDSLPPVDGLVAVRPVVSERHPPPPPAPAPCPDLLEIRAPLGALLIPGVRMMNDVPCLPVLAVARLVEQQILGEVFRV